MSALTSWVLATSALSSASGSSSRSPPSSGSSRRANALSQQFDVPGREGFETNQDMAAIYGNGGDVAPLVPVVQLAPGKTVDSPGVSEQLARRSREGRGRATRGQDRLLCVDPRSGVRLRRRPHHIRTGLHPGTRRCRSGEGRDPSGAGRARRRHRRRLPVEVTGLDALRAGASDSGGGTGVLLATLRGGAGRAPDSRLRLPLVHGDRAAADGARRDPDDVPPDLAARDHHRRVGDRPVPRGADRARDRDRLRAARRRPLARGAAAAERDQRGGGAERDAARRLRRRLQRHDRGDLAARARRRAGAGPAQHRHRGAADPAGQRRGRDHAPAGPPGDDRAEARLAPQPTRQPGQPRLVGVGPPRRAPPLGCGRDRRPPYWPRSSLRPRRSSSGTRAPTRSPTRALHAPASRSSRTPASAPVRSRPSTRSYAQATPTPSRRRSPASRVSAVRRRRATGAAAGRRSSP